MTPRSAAGSTASRRALRRVAVAACCLAASACGAPPAKSTGDTAPVSTTAIEPAAGPATPSPTTTTTTPIAPTEPDSPTTTTTNMTTTTVPPTTVPTTTTLAPPVVRSGADAGTTTPVGDPLAIRIPSLGVDSALATTGVDEAGAIEVPPDADIAGWFEGGPRPGERGPALIMGHVDSARTGPGVFYRLRDIQVGDIVIVDTTQGEQRFVVDTTEQHKKTEFPTEEVYGPVPGPALRLVTCGGEFDRSVRSYYDNIIVYLVPEGSQ